ncbi:hypothetical protein ACTXGQ_15295 [Marinobacter sp. 1Y8]
MTLIPLLFLVACGADENEERPPMQDASSAEADLKAACEALPSLCNSEPKPGFAKFKVGAADAVHWTGKTSCHQIDFRTGKQGDDRLTKAKGEIKSLCGDDDVRFEFVYRTHKNELGKGNWTSAFRPQSVAAAERLLDSCTSESSPKPSAVMGSWWKANNTYAENLLLDYIAPTVFATKLLPFSDDGIERLGEETIDGVKTVKFRNDSATVWMMADSGKNRPLRVMSAKDKTDVYFTEWDVPFAADIPEDMESLSDVCEVQ